MKRFLVFAGQEYYPLGGWADFKGSYDSIEEVIAERIETDWLIIRDVQDESPTAFWIADNGKGSGPFVRVESYDEYMDKYCG